MWFTFDLGINVERDFVFLWAYFAIGVEAMWMLVEFFGLGVIRSLKIRQGHSNTAVTCQIANFT